MPVNKDALKRYRIIDRLLSDPNHDYTTEQLLDENLKNKDGESAKEVRKRMKEVIKEILEKYPNAEVYEEQYTGSKMERPVFSTLISKLKSGDLLVVSRLDRFARNTTEGIRVVEDLFKRKVSIHILNIGLKVNLIY